MSRRLPPFAAVRAFEAAARHLSFKHAAEELCLSPSAISHQIRALEGYLDTALFERQGNRIVLTLTGESYAGKLTGLLDALDENTRALRDRQDGPFRVECTPGFAARWLMPRLHRLSFADSVRLQVSNGAPCTDFARNGADFVIQWRDTPTPGVTVEALMISRRFPVISPALRSTAALRRPADLLRMTLIRDETDDGWAEWFGAAGVKVGKMPAGPVFPNCELATTAVEQGHGISLAYEAVVADTLRTGRIERLFDTVTMPRLIYAMAYPTSRAGDRRTLEFRDWLLLEAGAGTEPARLKA